MIQSHEKLASSLGECQGKKILLGHLAAFGDCLYATAIARQIKQDYPNCYLTWAISASAAHLLQNNPYIDKIWEIPVHREHLPDVWARFEIEAKKCQQEGVFDEVFLTQIYPNNYQNYDGTVRASIFRGYPKPITVSVSPVIYLTDEEIANAKAFAEKHDLKNGSQVILFEYASKSGQSFVTPKFALTVAKKLVNQFPNIRIILSSHAPINTDHPAIIDGSTLSFRENAEISKYCHLLIGCSSGISWLCTSEWAKSLPMIQLLKKVQSVFASMSHDFNYFGLDSSHIIEMTECSEDHLTQCITTFFNNGLSDAYQNYHEKIVLNFDYYFSVINTFLKKTKQIEKYYTSIFNTYKRYGSEFILAYHTQPENNISILKSQITKIEDKVQDLQLQLQQKEEVIHEQSTEIRYLKTAVAIPGLKTIVYIRKRLLEMLRPRLGNLNQYAPRSLSVLSRPKLQKKNSSLKISIVTPSFAQGMFIEKTMQSVLEQDYPNIEYFVQDGGSTDETLAVLKRYESKLSGWISEPDSGQSQAINRGFSHTNGEIMAWLNSDDLLLPGALDCIADYFNCHPDVDVVYGNRLLIDVNDMEIGRWILPGHNAAAMSWADYVPQETMFWRRRIWEKVGGHIDESFRFAMDWDLLLRFLDAGARFAHIPRFLGAFRIHDHQKTSAAINEIGYKEMDRIRERQLGRVPSRKEVRKAVMPFLFQHLAVDIIYRFKTKFKSRAL